MRTQGIKVTGFDCRFWERPKHPNSKDWWHWTPKGWLLDEAVTNSIVTVPEDSQLTVEAKTVDVDGKLSVLFSGGAEGKHVIDLAIETATKKIATTIGLIVTDKK